jgi:uncharacterized protein (DUF433 family)
MSNKDQLLQAGCFADTARVATLPEELIDQTLTYVQTLQNPIQITPGICGGQARIRNTRIPVWTLVAYHQQGTPDDELLHNYPGLTPTDLSAAWDYYQQNYEAIDRLIAED